MIVVVHEAGVLDSLSKHYPQGSTISVGPGWPDSRVKWMLREGWVQEQTGESTTTVQQPTAPVATATQTDPNAQQLTQAQAPTPPPSTPQAPAPQWSGKNKRNKGRK